MYVKQLIVLGNGFDLACGLQSSYKDFFLDRFNKLFCDDNNHMSSTDDTELENSLHDARDNIWFSTSNLSNPRVYRPSTPGIQITKPDYFKEFSGEWTNNQSLTRWDIFFLFAEHCLDKKINKYQWQDIESVILEVISIALDFKNKYTLRLEYKDLVSIGQSRMPGEQLFKQLIYNISYVGKLSPEETAAELLNELEKFESIFASFINKQFDLNDVSSPYLSKAKELLRHLSRYYSDAFIDETSEISIFSFNYSLDERFQNILDDSRIKSWTNIHGIASFKDPNIKSSSATNDGSIGDGLIPAPIFGVDNHDIGINNSDDWRIIFTKPYRVIENGVNEIRRSNGYKNTDVITIYGHSLGQADYSYFETLFDENNLYDSNTRIEYFYYVGRNQIEKIKNRKNAIKTLYNLLLDYGKTLDNQHGTNIINKLNIENRLRIASTERILSI